MKTKNNIVDSIHAIHPYPAKFPASLPREIIREYAKKNYIILDPFCGSGTTLVEASIFGCNSIGVDVNGLSCLLSKVKTTKYGKKDFECIQSFKKKLNSKSIDSKNVFNFDNASHWFQKNVQNELCAIKEMIDNEQNSNAKDFLKIVLSSIIVKVSNQESDTRYAAIKKDIPKGKTIKVFMSAFDNYIEKIEKFSLYINKSVKAKIYNKDSRNLDFIKEKSIDLIITSPPYANTYDYYLYHKFRKLVLGIDVGFAQTYEIGSRREYSSLKKSPDQWEKDLFTCTKEMYRVLKSKSKAFIVIGDSVINKKLIKLDSLFTSIATKVGFRVEEIKSVKLEKHSKTFNPYFASKGKEEHIITLVK